MSIYKICLPDTDDTYIGSTHDLRQRLSVHKHKSRTMDTKLYTALGKHDYGQWRVEVLEELEGFVHHVDNAVDFCTMGGMQLVVGLLDNATVAENARSLAAVIVGSSASNNPSVQASAQQLGAVAALVRQLEHSNCALQLDFLPRLFL